MDDRDGPLERTMFIIMAYLNTLHSAKWRQVVFYKLYLLA